MPNPNLSFGIPVTKGLVRTRGEFGVTITFQLNHLHLQKLLRAQLYSKDKQILTEIITPHLRVTDIYQYPSNSSPVKFAFAQHEYSAIVYINFSIEFSDDTRIVFWFQRGVIRAINDNDPIDSPDEYMPLVTALVQKSMLQAIGRPIPEGVEKTITDYEEKIKRDNNFQNFYLADTFHLTDEELNKLKLKEEWKRTKIEFCQLVNDEYKKHQESYTSLRDCASKMFEQYSFKDKKWTRKQCYELSKKV